MGERNELNAFEENASSEAGLSKGCNSYSYAGANQIRFEGYLSQAEATP